MKANIFLIAIGILLLIKAVNGYKKGMVKKIVSIISLVFLCISVALVANGLQGYLQGRFWKVSLAVVLMAALGIVHHFLNLLLFPAKLLSKLVIVRGADKLLGIAVGILETVFILWTIYILLMLMDMGAIGSYIYHCVVQSPLLTWFYEHNQLVVWVKKLGAELSQQLSLIP